MTTTLTRLLVALLLLAAALDSSATITCNLSSAGFTAFYLPANPTTDSTQTFFTVTCTRTSNGDATSVSYSVFADNGDYASGTQNRAARGSARINYDIHRNASCSAPWQGLTTIAGSVAMPGLGTFTGQGNFWGCVPAGQGVAAGTYTDHVGMTLLWGFFSFAAGSFPVTIVTPATCTLNTPPGNVVFNYTSFGAAANASTTFRITCSSGMPYTMALDATAGTVIGLNYTLGLSTTVTAGTGVQQVHTVSGNMPAAQSGNCAGATCTASQARTLTITY